MRSKHVQSDRQRAPIWPSLLLGFFMTLFLVILVYATYLFLQWGKAVAANVPDLPALALPRLVRAVAAEQAPDNGQPGAPMPPAEEETQQAAPVSSGRVTILVMGVDNRPDEPVARTDTIMLMTINLQTGSAGMLSLPRDMLVHVPELNRDVKINTIHVLGEINKYPGGGPALLRQTVAEILGYPIDYYVRVNFDGFQQIIDLIGGVDIDVPKDIRDDTFPDSGSGYAPLYIRAGKQHMDGTLALKYARTRHTDSDYGRERRQQQVIMAIKDRVLQPGEMGALLPRLPGLALALANSVQTDMPVDRALALARNLDQVDLKSPTRIVIDNTMGEESNDATHGFILMPDMNKLRAAAAALFADAPTSVAARPAGSSAEAPARPQARIVVLNGGPESGAASRVATNLANDGFNVVAVGNADRSDYTGTWLVVHGDSGRDARDILVSRFGIAADHIRTESASADADLTLIVGADAAAAAALK